MCIRDRLGIQDDTKTKNSNRTIPIPEGLIKLFDRYKIQQDEQKRRFGKGYHHLDMIFSREDGYYIDPVSYTHLERVVVATVVYLLSLICNIIMNAIFIFGLLGLPKMGVAAVSYTHLYRKK